METMEFNLPTVILLAIVIVGFAFALRRAYLAWTGKGKGCHGDGCEERSRRDR